MNREKRPLLTDEPFEFEESAAEVQDLRKVTNAL